MVGSRVIDGLRIIFSGLQVEAYIESICFPSVAGKNTISIISRVLGLIKEHILIN